MSIAAPWLLLMITEAWRYGIHPADNNPRWPEPYRFIMGSAAMGFAAIVGMVNPRLGGLLAWGLLISAIIAQRQGTVPDVTNPVKVTGTRHPANATSGTQTGG